MGVSLVWDTLNHPLPLPPFPRYGSMENWLFLAFSYLVAVRKEEAATSKHLGDNDAQPVFNYVFV